MNTPEKTTIAYNCEHDIAATHDGVVDIGFKLYYRSYGKDEHPAIVMIMGLAQQYLTWPEGLITSLVNKGFRVVVYDNRDTGKTDSVDKGVSINLLRDYAKYKLGLPIKSNYSLYDMADDAIALMDALKIKQAHIVGMSMGGMIAQIVAANYPERVQSLAVLMSTTNNRNLPGARLRNTLSMLRKTKSDDLHERVSASYKGVRLLRGRRYKSDDIALLKRIRKAIVRAYRPEGYLRQTNAVLATGSFEDILPKISVPTVVVHGTDDPLLRVECGKRVARCIAHAKLELIDGLGHEFPESLDERFSRIIAENIAESQ